MTVLDSTSDYKYKRTATARSAGEVMVSFESYDLTEAVAQALANGDILRLRKCVLPANHVPVDFSLDTTDLDGGASLDIDVGLMNAAGTDLEGSCEFIDGSTDHRAAYRSTMKVVANTALFTRKTDANDLPQDRDVGIKFNTKPATPAAGNIIATLTYRAAEGEQGE